MPEQQRILVVDDERFNVNLMVDLLRDNYKMMVAKKWRDGTQSCDIRKSSGLGSTRHYDAGNGWL